MKCEEGFSLIEIMLVLAIAAAITMMGLRQYQLYKDDTEIQIVKYNVNLLFQGLAHFYQAKCSLYPGDPHPSELAQPTSLTNPFPIHIKQDLLDTQFLGNQFLPSLMVDAQNTPPGIPDGGYQGYFAQLTPHTLPRLIPTQTTQIGTILLWSSQVAILLKTSDPTEANLLKDRLGGDCIFPVKSPSNSAQSMSCPPSIHPPSMSSNAPTQSHYLIIWQRPPTEATWETRSTYWLYNPLNKQFKQMYTIYPILYSTGTLNGSDQMFRCSY